MFRDQGSIVHKFIYTQTLSINSICALPLTTTKLQENFNLVQYHVTYNLLFKSECSQW